MARRENSKANPWIISYGRSDYDGSAIDSLTPIHKAQQIHKYRLGLFAVGIVAIVAAFLTVILICIRMASGNTKVVPGISTTSMTFLITLFIDIVLMVNLNRYINDKKPLILYIPCCIAMLAFSIPQIIAVVAMFGVNIPEEIKDMFKSLSWANYIIFVVCIIYIVAEIIRMVVHRNDFNLKQEIYKALK